MARNPTFVFTTARYVITYAESILPYHFFVDVRSISAQLDFWRSFRLDATGADINVIAAPRLFLLDYNKGAGNYVVDLMTRGSKVESMLVPHEAYQRHIALHVPKSHRISSKVAERKYSDIL